MDLSIITVGFKSKSFLEALLPTVLASRGTLALEMFVIDNASNDGTIESLRAVYGEEKDGVRFSFIQNTENLGFAKANNQGIRASKGRYVLLLNPDMRLEKDTLTNAVAWMDEHPHVALAGPRLVDKEGNVVPHVRRFPTWMDQVCILLKIPHLVPSVLNRYLAKDFSYDHDARVDSIRGSFFLMRRSTIDAIGGLDEQYFIWFEEMDYCKRLAEQGLETWYMHSVRCMDFVGRSFAFVSGRKKQEMFTESMKKYFDTWHPKSAWVIHAFRPIALMLVSIADLLLFPRRQKHGSLTLSAHSHVHGNDKKEL